MPQQPESSRCEIEADSFHYFLFGGQPHDGLLMAMAVHDRSPMQLWQLDVLALESRNSAKVST